MGTGTPPRLPQRTWTVTIHPHRGELALRCTTCGPLPHPSGACPVRRAALAHLADHASRTPLPPHLRTCQCREDGCRRHPRHRGCDGPLLLLLTRDLRGRTWHLADTCHACAAATPHSARVPEASSRKAREASDRAASSNTPFALSPGTAVLSSAHAPGPDDTPAYDVAEEGLWWLDDAEAYDWLP